jgi:selenocysteine insertion sequence-binding protein 2
MTFSYADATKKKQQQVAERQPTSAGADYHEKQQQQQQQPQVKPQKFPPRTNPSGAWGGNGRQHQQQQNSQMKSAWGTKTTSAKNPAEQTKNSIIQSSQDDKKKSAQAKLPSSSKWALQPSRVKPAPTTTSTTSDNAESSWTAVAANQFSKQKAGQTSSKNIQQPKTQQPTPVILKKNPPTSTLPAKDNAASSSKTKAGLPTQQGNPSSSGSKKSKNSKPKLKSMSIGDLIVEPKKFGGSKMNPQPKQNHQQQSQQRSEFLVDSVQDFPALGRTAAATTTTPQTKVVWGVKQTHAVAQKSDASGNIVAKLPSNASKQKESPSGQKDSSKKKNKKKKNKAEKNGDPSSSTPSGISSFFQPRARTLQSNEGVGGDPNARLEGEEHKLLRLMQERTVYQKKGRQRVAPRKKRFTALKKKVLQERLDKWRELHPEETEQATKTDKSVDSRVVSSCTLCIYNYTSSEELEDDDEYEETVENLKGMATKIGSIHEVFVPRQLERETKDEDDEDCAEYPVFVLFQKESDAAAAQACWNGLVIGGSKLVVNMLDVSRDDDSTPWSSRAAAAESRWQKSKSSSNTNAAVPVEILLQKVLTDDDYEDEDCMKESLADLEKVAVQFGKLQSIRAAEAKDGNVVLSYLSDLPTARTIADELCKTVVGGQPLYAFIDETLRSDSVGPASTLLLEKILTNDDLDDEDCLNETLSDIKELCQRHGDVSNISIKGNGVKVTYSDHLSAEKAVGELDGLILGGNVISASMLNNEEKPEGENFVVLNNVLTEDDLADEDCLAESLDDIRELATKYGVISSIDVLRADDTASIRIEFDGDGSIVLAALKGFDGMVVGGQIVSASRPGSDSSKSQSDERGVHDSASGDKRKTQNNTISGGTDKKARTDDKAPLYSGDKIIPERFAEMKRVPKIPNACPREYATVVNDERVKPLLTEMLGELMRLQKRAIEDKNAKARRRIVMGLREVARGIRSHKVKMVVMANNLDQYGAIDEKLQEIIDLAKSEGVPLFYEFTKRTLGKAIGKNIKIAVVGIQNADGAHQPFKKLNAIAARM